MLRREGSIPCQRAQYIVTEQTEARVHTECVSVAALHKSTTTQHLLMSIGTTSASIQHLPRFQGHTDPKILARIRSRTWDGTVQKYHGVVVFLPRCEF